MSLLLPLLFMARVTFFYDTGHTMASGRMPFPGAAACSNHFAMGTVIRLQDWYDVTCLDRGHINSRRWVDIYCADAECGAFVARKFSPYVTAQVVSVRE